MLIKKGSVVANFIKTFLEESKTKGISSEGTIFVRDSSFEIVSNEINYVVKSDNDIQFKSNNTKILYVINKILETEDVEIAKDGSKIKIKDFEFNVESVNRNDFNEYTDCIKFTKEQFNNLAKYFEISKGNWVSNPALVDVIQIGIKEGNLFKVVPGTTVYAIGKFDATVDETTLNSTFGHTVAVFLLPKKIFDIVKNEESVSFGFEDYDSTNSLYVTTPNFKICYNSSRRSKTKAFERNVGLRFSDGKDAKDLNNLKKYFEYVNDIGYVSDDEVVKITSSSNKLKMNLFDSLDVSVDGTVDGFDFSLDAYAFKFILNNGIDSYKKLDNSIIFKSNEDYYLIAVN